MTEEATAGMNQRQVCCWSLSLFVVQHGYHRSKLPHKIDSKYPVWQKTFYTVNVAKYRSFETGHLVIANYCCFEYYYAVSNLKRTNLSPSLLRPTLIAFTECLLTMSKQHLRLKHLASPHFWVRFREVTLFPNHFSILSGAPEAPRPGSCYHQLSFKAFSCCRPRMIYSHGSLFISSQCVWATTVSFHLMFQVIWP